MKSKLQPMNAVRVVKVKKMGEILFRSYIIRVARAFFKIDKAMEDYNGTAADNSSAIMHKKYDNQSWNIEMSEKRSMRSPPRGDRDNRESNLLRVPSEKNYKKPPIVPFPMGMNDGLKTPTSERGLKVERYEKKENERVKSSARTKRPRVVTSQRVTKQVVLLP